MLLGDLRVAPAARPIELRDDRRLVLAPHLVDAVLVAVEREQTAVAADADGVERVEDELGCQPWRRDAGRSPAHSTCGVADDPSRRLRANTPCRNHSPSSVP